MGVYFYSRQAPSVFLLKIKTRKDKKKGKYHKRGLKTSGGKKKGSYYQDHSPNKSIGSTRRKINKLGHKEAEMTAVIFYLVYTFSFLYSASNAQATNFEVRFVLFFFAASAL